jgi:hypothetical protein
VSHICKHELEDFHDCSPPPVYGCRGIIKNFRSSRIASVSRAAAPRRKSQAGRKRQAPPQTCSYCDGALFEVTKVFCNSYDDYHDMWTAVVDDDYGPTDYDSEGEPIEKEEISSSVTGYVCTGGHLILGLFGYPKHTAGKLEGKTVPKSGGGLELEQGIVKFLCDTLSEESGGERLADGAKFVKTLELDQMILSEQRMQRVLAQWPTPLPQPDFESTCCVEVSNKGRPWLSKDLAVLHELLKEIPKQSSTLSDYISKGEPDLDTAMEAVLSEMGAKRRKEEVKEALSRAGYNWYRPPDQVSMDSFVKVRC